MGMNKVSWYVYSNIPGAGKGWSLAVCAINRRDADDYIRKYHRGGKFVYDVTNGGTIKADCGATTTAAHQAIKDNLAKMMSETC